MTPVFQDCWLQLRRLEEAGVLASRMGSVEKRVTEAFRDVYRRQWGLPVVQQVCQ